MFWFDSMEKTFVFWYRRRCRQKLKKNIWILYFFFHLFVVNYDWSLKKVVYVFIFFFYIYFLYFLSISLFKFNFLYKKFVITFIWDFCTLMFITHIYSLNFSYPNEFIKYYIEYTHAQHTYPKTSILKTTICMF